MKSISIIVSMTFMTIAMNVLGGAAQAQQNCPKAGELKNFAQIAAQAEIFNGCEVTTDVKFGGFPDPTIGNVYSAPIYGYDLKGSTLISVTSLNGSSMMLVSVANDKADPLFNLKSGDSLRLRGAVDYRKIGTRNINAVSGGVSVSIFRSQSFEVLGTQKPCTCP